MNILGYEHRYDFRVNNTDCCATLYSIQAWCTRIFKGNFNTMLGDENHPDGLVFFTVVGDTPDDFLALQLQYPGGIYKKKESTHQKNININCPASLTSPMYSSREELINTYLKC